MDNSELEKKSIKLQDLNHTESNVIIDKSRNQDTTTPELEMYMKPDTDDEEESKEAYKIKLNMKSKKELKKRFTKISQTLLNKSNNFISYNKGTSHCDNDDNDNSKKVKFTSDYP